LDSKIFLGGFQVGQTVDGNTDKIIVEVMVVASAV
jgi:hypothetical protein